MRCITRHIPNTLTCMNLFSGCIAAVMAFEMRYELALFFIFLGAVFDFFDGMAARLFDARSPIGKDLDSLADDVSFGVAPAMIVFSLFKELDYSACPSPAWADYLPYLAFLIAVFSALRLAKFNIDTRQTTSFIGLPTPANALFWASLATGYHDLFMASEWAWLVLLLLVALFSWLLVSEIPMFSLKFKNLTLRDNKVQYLFLLGTLCLLLLLGFIRGLATIIVWFILVSIATQRKK